MANYNAVTRTNYFQVKDEEKFRALMAEVKADDTVKVWKITDLVGVGRFGFGLYGSINGIKAEGEQDSEYDEFTNRLRECVADDDAIIILEAGSEKLRYVTGAVTVITSKEVKCVDMTYLATDIGREMLGNPEWNPRCEY